VQVPPTMPGYGMVLWHLRRLGTRSIIMQCTRIARPRETPPAEPQGKSEPKMHRYCPATPVRQPRGSVTRSRWIRSSTDLSSSGVQILPSRSEQKPWRAEDGGNEGVEPEVPLELAVHCTAVPRWGVVWPPGVRPRRTRGRGPEEKVHRMAVRARRAACRAEAGAGVGAAL